MESDFPRFVPLLPREPPSADRTEIVRASGARLGKQAVNYSLADSTGTSAFRAGRRTARTLPLFPPPQKNRSPPSASRPDTVRPAASPGSPALLPYQDRRA